MENLSTFMVEGDRFAAESLGEGRYRVVWISGPHPGYGFNLASNLGADTKLNEADLRVAAENFLVNVDLETGYLKE